MSLLDNIMRAFRPTQTKAPQTQSSYGRGPYARVRVQMAINGWDPRNQGAQMLRNFSRRNEWVRIAIDRRKSQIAQAPWKIIRNDDPQKPADPRVVAQVRKLLRYVNPKRESFRTLLDMVIEDLLVIDAGCVEKERTFAGDIAALWAVDGATMIPDPTWDGRDPEKPRYFQFIDGVPAKDENGNDVALLNQDLLYIMRTPTTYSPVGWSYVETLVRAIEADLYGEQYDYEMLKQTAPAGVLDLGRGIPRQYLEEAREYYESEIAGSKDMMIVGAEPIPGEPNGNGGPSVNFIPFARSNREQQRDFYKKWLVKKIAIVFGMDPTVFGITDDSNRATAKETGKRTDEGHVADAKLIEEYISREIVWEIDENHDFAFDGITARDEAEQADIDVKYVNAGIWTANEVRVAQGKPELPGGETLRSSPPAASEPGEDEDDAPTGGGKPNEDDDEDETGEGAKRNAPFVGARRQTRSERLNYLSTSTP